MIGKNRDLRVVSFLKEQGVATTEQLYSIGDYKNRNSMYVHLHRLKQKGLVDSKPLSNVVGVKESMSNFQPSLNRVSGFHKRRYYFLNLPKEKQIKESYFIHPSMLKHQIFLNEIRLLVSRLFPKSTIYNEPEAEKMLGCEIAPDLLIEHKGAWIAFEGERTRKRDNSRYTRKWVEYSQSKVSKIIYFCERPEDERYLARIAQSYGNIGFMSTFSPNKIYRYVDGYSPLNVFLEEDYSTDLTWTNYD